MNRYIISEMGKATDFKFGLYIHNIHVHRNKSPLKILEKRERWRIQGLSKCFGHPVARTISGRGKATNFKFFVHIHRIDRNKCPSKLSGKVTVGVVRDSQKFLGHA